MDYRPEAMACILAMITFGSIFSAGLCVYVLTCILTLLLAIFWNSGGPHENRPAA